MWADHTRSGEGCHGLQVLVYRLAHFPLSISTERREHRRKPIAPGVNGPVDRDPPVLVARNPDGTIRALVANYACHCTTGGPEINKVHGDWAGIGHPVGPHLSALTDKSPTISSPPS